MGTTSRLTAGKREICTTTPLLRAVRAKGAGQKLRRRGQRPPRTAGGSPAPCTAVGGASRREAGAGALHCRLSCAPPWMAGHGVGPGAGLGAHPGVRPGRLESATTVRAHIRGYRGTQRAQSCPQLRHPHKEACVKSCPRNLGTAGTPGRGAAACPRGVLHTSSGGLTSVPTETAMKQ